MNEASKTFSQPNLWDTPNATSLPGEGSGALPCERQDGPTTDRCGPEAAPAHLSAQQAKAKGLQTLVTSGLIGYDSSKSYALQCFLENRLRQRLDTAGSTLFRLIWRQRITPLGKRYLERAALAHRTSGNAYTSVPTPDTGISLTDANWEQRREQCKKKHNNGNGFGMTLGMAVQLATVPTPQTHDLHTAKTAEQIATMRAAGYGVSNLNEIVNPSTVPTPTADDPNNATRDSGQFQSLTRTVRLASLPAPQTMDTLPPMEYEKRLNHTSRPNRTTSGNLREVVTLASMATPSVRDHKDTGDLSKTQFRKDGKERNDVLPRQAQLADSGQTATGGTEGTGSTGQLNPAYSRWLMGVPPEWDDFAYTAMQSLSQRRKRSLKRT